MNYNKLLIFFIALFGVVSCQSEDDLLQQQIDDGSSILSIEDYEFSPIGSTVSVAFTANSSWTLKDCPDWLEVDKASGRKGTTTIKLSAICNETRKVREATLVFESRDGSSSSMKVRQAFPYINISKDSLSFNWNECRTENENVDIQNNPQIIKISSNVEWRIVEYPVSQSAVDFKDFTFSVVSGRGDCDLSIIPIRYNYDKVPYEAKYRLYPVVVQEDGSEVELSSKAADSYILKIHQNNLRFLIDDSVDDIALEFSELNDNDQINLTIDAELEWQVADSPEWIRMSQTSGVNIVTVNFKADGPNPTCDERSGTIRLVTEAGAYRDIQVSQKPYVFSLDVDPSGIHIGNDDLSEHKFYLETTGTWEIKEIPSWLTVIPKQCDKTTPQSGVQRHEITVIANGQNLDLVEDYICNIQVASSMNTLKEGVNVTQDKFIFEVTPSPTLSDIPTMNTSEYDVSINSSGPWEILGKPEWVDVSNSSSSNKGEQIIKVRANCGNPDLSQDRTATLCVVSLNHKEVGQEEVKNIYIKQRKYIFEVTPLDNIQLPAYKDTFENFSINVKASSSWEVVECPTWITPDLTGGDGIEDATITFTPTINTAKEKRDGNIVIKSLYNDEQKSIYVKQDAFVFDNTSQSYSVAVMNNQNYPVSFDLTAEAGWELVSDSEKDINWLNPSTKSGTGTGMITFTPLPNPELKEREGHVTIRSVVTNEGKNLTFTQERYEFDATEESFAFTELDENLDIISVISSGPWIVEDLPSWIELSSYSENSSKDITIKAKNNTTRENRNETFKIVSTLNNLKRKVSVCQEAYLFDDTSHQYSYTTLEERTDEFDVISSGAWKAMDVPEWIRLSDNSGAGNEDGIKQTISLTSMKNLTEADRYNVIKIVNNDNPSFVKEIHVFQDKFDFHVDNEVFVYTAPLDVSVKYFNIVCPSEWSISSDKNWVSTDVSSGTGNKKVSIMPQQNLTTEDRTAQIRVTSTLNSLVRILTVSQPKFEFDLNKEFHKFDSPLEEDNSSLSVSVNCSATWTVQPSDDWIMVSVNGENDGDGSFSIKPKSNYNTTTRTGKVLVTSMMNGLTKEIEIEQAAYHFDASSTNLEFEACEAKVQTVPISCSGNWEIAKTVAWITVEASNTKGDGNISITVEDNGTEQSRSGIITVTSTDVPSLVKTIKVTQNGHTLDVSKTMIGLDAAPEHPVTLDVTTVGSWSVSSDQSWCVVAQNTTKGNGIVTISASVNNTVQDRNATITVACDNTDVTKQVSVTQSKYEFNEEEVVLDFSACPKNQETVSVISSGRWGVSSDDKWLTIRQSVTTGNGSVTISADVNPTLEPRQGDVIITCLDNEEWVKRIVVNQAEYIFDTSNVELTFEAVSDKSETVDITSSGSWDVSLGETWLQVEPTSGEGNASIKITVEPNTDGTPRKTQIAIKSRENSNLKKVVSIIQKGIEQSNL